ncbi:MAG: hypothetical protein HKN19_13765 [Halioglobus sp.]|nr:hypothetical protein [Halioglobus sp.]
MNHSRKIAAILVLPFMSAWAVAQSGAELTPEQLDAAFTAQDAAREAALWSDEEIVRAPVDPLGKMSAESDLVVIGTVTAQEIVYDDRDRPFTHTTLAITEVVDGSYEGGLITLVQEGGPLKHKPENVLILSHTHYFTPGEEELLFLALNPDSPHPQSRVEIKKRFGVLNGKVFSENGRALVITATEQAPGYTLSFSRDRNPHPRFKDFKIGPHEFSKGFTQRGYESESPGQPASRGRPDTQPGYQAGVDIGTFKNALSGQGG